MRVSEVVVLGAASFSTMQNGISTFEDSLSLISKTSTTARCNSA